MFFYLSMIETAEDKTKFERLYEAYRKLMFYVANQILKDDYLAEDAVHNTFLKLMDNLDKIDDVHCHKTKSYIVTMVKNHSINLYNQRKNRKIIPIEELEYTLSADVNVYPSEEFDELTSAILKLPVIYKEVLTLKYVQEFSNSEIALMLEISEQTVRKRLERSKHKLHDILKKEKN